MLSRILRWFPGWVRVRTEGGYPARLLNDLNRVGIPVWQIDRQGEILSFSCLAGDYRSIRPLSRRACVRMRMVHKRGLPFWRHRYRHRKGLIVGLALYIAILALLSGRIWVIQIPDTVGIDHATIRETIARSGVRLGARMDRVDIKGLQISGPDHLHGVGWITVNPSGCVAQVEVMKHAPTPQVVDLTHPSDMVALCDGRILKLSVRSGIPLVKEGEAVTAGTRLVLGRKGTDSGALCRSYGEVIAETRRQITLSIPLFYSRWVDAGKPVYRPTISLLCWDFPLYSKTPLQGKYRHFRTSRFLTAEQKTLPLGITLDTYTPQTAERAARTVEQAQRLTRATLKEQERALFVPDTYQKTEETILVRDGQLVLVATYLCQENIAIEVPPGHSLPDS